MIDKLKYQYIDKSKYPVEAAKWLIDYIEENNISDKDFRLYNDYDFGSYLLYKGIPVFIDSRAEQPYSPEFNEDITIFDDYMDVKYGRITYKNLFEKYDINYAIVYKDTIENTYLAEDKNAIELYNDDIFVIYKYEN